MQAGVGRQTVEKQLATQFVRSHHRITNAEGLKRLLRQAKKDYEMRAESSSLFGSPTPAKLLIPGLNAPLRVTLPKQRNGLAYTRVVPAATLIERPSTEEGRGGKKETGAGRERSQGKAQRLDEPIGD